MITINDTVRYLNRLHKDKLHNDGINVDTISIYQDMYKTFPSYKKYIGTEIYTQMMDEKVLRSLLGTSDIVDTL